MEGRTAEIIKALEELFFGQSYFEHIKIVESILACRSLKEFRKIGIDPASPICEKIFEMANSATRNGEMTRQRAEHIFNQVKAVRATATFI